ncbi:hypothetical protein Tco_1321317 [Tanacetum coccineum]
MGPFKVLSKLGDVAYRLELPQQLGRVHNTFHVSNLKKCLSDESLVILLDELHVNDKLHFMEEPAEVMDREIKQLKRSRVPIIKVRWNSKRDTVMSLNSTSSEEPDSPEAAPASPDYVPGPEEPEQAPLSPDYVSGPEYPEYLASSDEEAPIEDHPYVVADSPIALSPGYIADSSNLLILFSPIITFLIPLQIHIIIFFSIGDDDDSSDDDEEEKEASEEEEAEEEEEHLAPIDYVVAPVVDHVSTEPFKTDESAATPPSPPACQEEVERLLALPPPSPLISLSPPSADERLARCLAAPALPSSPLPIVPHPYGSPNHVRAPPGFRAAMGRLRASSPSTHHPLHPSPPLPPPPSSLHVPPYVPTSLPLPSSPLPPLPASLFIPPLVDRKEDTPEAELPPCKRLCLTALTLRYEVGESLTAAPRPAGGHGIVYGFIGTLDAKTSHQRAEEVGYGIRDTWVDLREAAEEIALVTLEGVNTRVTELAAVQEQDTQDIYAVIEDAQDRQIRIFQSVETLIDDRQSIGLRDVRSEALVYREAWHSLWDLVRLVTL